MKRPKLSERLFNQAHALTEMGLTKKQVGLILKKSQATIWLWLKYPTLEEYRTSLIKRARFEKAKREHSEMHEDTVKDVQSTKPFNGTSDAILAELMKITTALQELVLIEEHKKSKREEYYRLKKENQL